MIAILQQAAFSNSAAMTSISARMTCAIPSQDAAILRLHAMISIHALPIAAIRQADACSPPMSHVMTETPAQLTVVIRVSDAFMIQ